MRVDLALKYLCLANSRSSVRHWCEDGSLTVNDRPAKPSTPLRPGDRVAIRLRTRTLVVRVLRVPERQLSRAASAECVTRLEEIGPDETEDE